jgi:hypothetical protein
MAKKFFSPQHASNIGEYVLAAIITGLFMGVGNVLGQIITKYGVKKAGYAGLLPTDMAEEADK